MRHIFKIHSIAFFILAVFLFSCEEPPVENGFRLSGTIEGGQGEVSLLRYEGNSVLINTVQLKSNGSYTFEVPNALKAAYSLQHNTTLYPFVYESEEDNSIVLNAIADSPLKGDYEVRGSEGSRVLQEYYKRYRVGSITLKDFNDMANSPKHPYMQSFMTSRCLQYGGQGNGVHLKSLNNLRKADPSSKLVAYYDQNIKKSMNTQNQKARKRMEDGPLKIGQHVPNITLPNPDGKIMQLSELQGKVVLVDFWASWCGPCRRYGNPKLVKLYNKYDKDKFAIMNVALERGSSNKKWVDAIKKDGLVWPYQVVDASRKYSPLYGASRIPRIYVIDKEGKLAAINPQSPELEKTIEKLMKT